MSTLFSKLISRELPSYTIYEDDQFYAFLDINPVKKGHTLLVPKEEHAYVFDMPEQLYQQLWQTVRLIEPCIKQAMQSRRVAVAVEGFSVPHVHVHLVPINSGTEFTPNTTYVASSAELVEVQQKIRSCITSI